MRSDGGMSWDGADPAQIIAHREAYFQSASLNIRSSAWTDQVHGASVHLVTASDHGRGAVTPSDRIPATDALIAADTGTMLCTLHADCAPVYYYAPDARLIGLAHCGWRGTLQGLAGKMMREMTARGADAKAIHVAIGPTISTARYEFGEVSARQFQSRFGAQVIMTAGGKLHLDLVAALITDLLENGLDPEKIPPRPPCTFDDTRFASFRRDGSPTRSMVAWLSLTPTN